ncbi:gas vesicle protein GvpG [Nonomuraea sp. NPDC004297]
MGLISLVLCWPVAPLRGVIRLGELIQDEVERELHDPKAVRHRLEDIEAARAAGLMSEEEEALEMRAVLQSLIDVPDPDEPVRPQEER